MGYLNGPQLKVCTLEQFEGGDGVPAKDQAAFAAALALMSAGTYNCLELGAKTYTVTGGTLPAGCSIIGQGPDSILQTTSSAAVITIGGQLCLCRDFQIVGNYTTSSTSQTGITTGFEQLEVIDVVFNNLGGIGMEVLSLAGGEITGPIIVGCRAINCFWAGFLAAAADKTAFIGCQATGCGAALAPNTGAGFYIDSPNVFMIGCNAGQNYNGFLGFGGGNDGHWIISGCRFVHSNVDNVNVGDVSSGAVFSGCVIGVVSGGSGGVTLRNIVGQTKGIKFIGCWFAETSFNFQSSLGTSFDGCQFDVAAGALTITTTGGATTRWVNCTDENGNYPVFISLGADGSQIGDRVQLATQRGAAASGGGTFVTTIVPGTNFPNDGVFRVKAQVEMSHSSAGHVDTAAALSAECVVSVKNAVAAFVAATAGSTNPINSNTATYAAALPQASDAGFTGAGPPTAVWTISAGTVVMTVANPGATNATVQVSFDVMMLLA
jgi:hypothetical protein